ncbi:MAG: hypothetical protein WBX19_01770 [Terracidiphilus sp.]
MANEATSSVSVKLTPNGPGAAAVLAAGIGCFALGVISVLADKLPALSRVLNVYKPTGPLSGVSTTAIVTWLVAWAVLHYRWQGCSVDLGRMTGIALLLLAGGVLLTFPPVGDLF